ncbi:cysteine desulfurase sulfur acceptor subunit CsdE [uncultured Cedecea sp.]|uniref:cysteine desulfurase sulfur acceptor subunit CsdE n=1 Tax=uncultured Cedecea sp. TaxID=988762 RepID=UPI0026388FF4|nr:cysteine desulfurase sulfur acceptor subunit CsdE [uncultured Cedecea sp.]
MNTSHPFGSKISPESLKNLFTPLKQWEDRYRQLILLGKQLPPLANSLKEEQFEISGCENRVWLGHIYQSDGTLHFFGDSEGRIVRGLLAVLLTAIEGKTAQQLLTVDPLTLFDDLGLRNQLSASRSDGLHALAQRVQQIARQAV